MHYLYKLPTWEDAIDTSRPKQWWAQIGRGPESIFSEALPTGITNFGELFLAVLAAQVSGVGVSARWNNVYYPVAVRLHRDIGGVRHVSVVLFNGTGDNAYLPIEDHPIPLTGPSTVDEYLAEDFWDLLTSPKMLSCPIAHTPSNRDPVLTYGPIFGTQSMNGVDRQVRFVLDDPNHDIGNCDLIDRGATESVANGLSYFAGFVEAQLGVVHTFGYYNDLFLSHSPGSAMHEFFQVTWDSNGLPGVRGYDRAGGAQEWSQSLTISSPVFAQIMFGVRDFFERAKAAIPIEATTGPIDFTPVTSAIANAVTAVNSATRGEVSGAVDNLGGQLITLGRELSLAISQISALDKDTALDLTRAILVGVGEALMPPDQWTTHVDHVTDLQDTIRRTFPDLLGDIELFGEESTGEE